MNGHHRTIVQVREAWSSWRVAEAGLNDLEDIHWRQPAGAPRPILHAYIQCTKLRGDIPHCCTGTAPHRLLVCVLKCAIPPSVHEQLARRADSPYQSQQPSPARPAGMPRPRTLLAGTEWNSVHRRGAWRWAAAGAGLAVAAMIVYGRSRVTPARANRGPAPDGQHDVLAA